MSRSFLFGLTYDLRDDYLKEGWSEEETAEFDRVSTIEAIEGALQQLGHRTERIGNVRALAAALASGRRWDLVFNIAEGMFGFGRESQVPALLDAYRIPYTFSDPLSCAVTLHKSTAKHVLRDQGIPTPPFAVVESEADAQRVDLPYPLFVKPIAGGTSVGVGPDSRVTNRDELLRTCRKLLHAHKQPLLVETYLPGREVTVGILGTGEKARCVGGLEVVLKGSAEAHAYTYANKEDCELHVTYLLAHGAFALEAEELALRAWRGLGCRDGGRVDLRADGGGRLVVLEVNPLPGMHPLHSDLPILCGQAGIAYVELIRAIVDSASERVVAEGPGDGARATASARSRVAADTSRTPAGTSRM
jgi:D-alanine-D-alanine ligase